LSYSLILRIFYSESSIVIDGDGAD